MRLFDFLGKARKCGIDVHISSDTICPNSIIITFHKILRSGKTWKLTAAYNLTLIRSNSIDYLEESIESNLDYFVRQCRILDTEKGEVYDREKIR